MPSHTHPCRSPRRGVDAPPRARFEGQSLSEKRLSGRYWPEGSRGGSSSHQSFAARRCAFSRHSSQPWIAGFRRHGRRASSCPDRPYSVCISPAAPAVPLPTQACRFPVALQTVALRHLMPDSVPAPNFVSFLRAALQTVASAGAAARFPACAAAWADAWGDGRCCHGRPHR